MIEDLANAFFDQNGPTKTLGIALKDLVGFEVEFGVQNAHMRGKKFEIT
jgi:hypothetical protein